MAHPYRARVRFNPYPDNLLDTACKNHVFDLVDAIEVLNGRSKDKENYFARELCHRLGRKEVGGSDAHSLSDVPSYATEFEREISSLEELIVELKEGRFKAIDFRQRGLIKQ